MALNSVRNYLHEKNVRLRYEWKQFQKLDSNPTLMTEAFATKDFIRVYHGPRNKLSELENKRALQSEYDKILQSMKLKNLDKKEPYAYYEENSQIHVPNTRLPSPGIQIIPHYYHKGRVVTPDERIIEQGYPLHTIIDYLIRHKYPQYLNIAAKYCRPLGTTDATFKDFNKPQYDYTPFTENELPTILELVTHPLNPTPYQPIHFKDTMYTGMPLNTRTE